MGGSSSNNNNNNAISANTAQLALLSQQQAQIDSQRASQAEQRVEIAGAKSEIDSAWADIAAGEASTATKKKEVKKSNAKLNKQIAGVAVQQEYNTDVKTELDTQITDVKRQQEIINTDFNTSGQITVGYSPTDFYYVMANEGVPNEHECQTTYSVVTISDEKCVPYNPSTINANFLTQLQSCTNNPTQSFGDYKGNDIPTCLQAFDDNNQSAGTASSYHNVYITDYPQWKSWQDNSSNCYKKELCKNKDNAQRIQKIQNNHLGSDQNFNDTMTLYKKEYAKMVNLSVGILVIAIVIFYSK